MPPPPIRMPLLLSAACGHYPEWLWTSHCRYNFTLWNHLYSNINWHLLLSGTFYYPCNCIQCYSNGRDTQRLLMASNVASNVNLVNFFFVNKFSMSVCLCVGQSVYESAKKYGNMNSLWISSWSFSPISLYPINTKLTFSLFLWAKL